MRKEFYVSDEIRNIDEAIRHTLDCIAICSGSEYESDRIALQHFKEEYNRLEGVRAEAMKDWLAVW